MRGIFCRYCKFLLPILAATAQPPQNPNTFLWHLQRHTPITVWNGTAATALNLGKEQLGLKLQYTRLLEAQGSIATRDEGEGELGWQRAISSQLSVWPRFLGYYLYDTRAVGVSQHLRWRPLLGILYRFQQGSVHGELGWEALHQFQRRDEGISGGMQLRWNQLGALPAGAAVEGEGTLYRGQRRHYSLQAELAWYPSRRDTIFRGAYRFGLRDFPIIAISSEFQRRLEHSAVGELSLTEYLLPRLQWRAFLRAEHNRVQHTWNSSAMLQAPTRRLRFSTTAVNGLRWAAPIGSLAVVMNIQYIEEFNRRSSSLPSLQQGQLQEELRDYNSLWTQLQLTAEGAPSARDSLTLQTTLGLLRYDTPSPANMDDRDEQHLSAQLAYVHQWERGIALRAAMDLQGRHTVFLFAPRSAWNHWFYGLAIRCEGQWISDLIHWNPRWEVLASYTVRDYPNSTVLRDFAHRQWGYRDSLSVHWSSGFGEIRLLLRRSSVGMLNWKRFAETPQRSTEELSAGILVGWHGSKQLWGIGIQAAQYRYTEYHSHSSYRQESIGPQARLELRTQWGTIRASGWYEWRRSLGRKQWRTVPWLLLSLQQP